MLYTLHNIHGPLHTVPLNILNLDKRSYGVGQPYLMSTKSTTKADNTHFQNSPVQYKPIQKTLVPATS